MAKKQYRRKTEEFKHAAYFLYTLVSKLTFYTYHKLLCYISGYWETNSQVCLASTYMYIRHAVCYGLEPVYNLQNNTQQVMNKGPNKN